VPKKGIIWKNITRLLLPKYRIAMLQNNISFSHGFRLISQRKKLGAHFSVAEKTDLPDVFPLSHQSSDSMELNNTHAYCTLRVWHTILHSQLSQQFQACPARERWDEAVSTSFPRQQQQDRS
jgi:hypothetical protein